MKVVALRPNKEGASLDDLGKMTNTQLRELSIKTINRLSDDIVIAMAELSQHKAQLQLVIEDRYGDDFNHARKAKEFGLVRVEDGDYVVEQTVPKLVSWDQDLMVGIENKLTSEWDEDPTEYIETKRTVQEKKFSAWPTAIKKLFQPARTTKPGKAKVEIKRKEQS